MKDSLEYFGQALIRLLATGIDLMLICCLTFGLITLAVFFNLPLNQDSLYFTFGLTILIWSGFESYHNRTLGKFAAGLRLEISGVWPRRIFQVLFRNLIKGLMLFCVYYLSIISQHYLYPDVYKQMSWSVLIPPSLIWFVVTACLYLLKTNRQPQDWLTGTRVVNHEYQLPFWQQSINLVGAGIGCFIIFILLNTAIQHRPYDGRSKLSSVKANMHTLQTVVETYAVDWGGVYAPNLTALKYEGTRPGREYWKEFTNPFTAKSGAHLSYSNNLPPTDQPNPLQKGQVIYVPVISDGPIIRYYIYGLDKNGGRIQDKGGDLTLSNS